MRWRERITFMAGQGVTVFYEIGAGQVLSGLTKRIATGVEAIPIGVVEDVARFAAARQP